LSYAYSWTGCYVGGNGGGVWVRKDYSLTQNRGLDGFRLMILAATTQAAGSAASRSAAIISSRAGWVVGIQGDYDWTKANGSPYRSFRLGGPTLRQIPSRWPLSPAAFGYAWDRFPWLREGRRRLGKRDDYSWGTLVQQVAGVVFGGQRDAEWLDGRRRRPNMPSPIGSPASSNTTITISAPATSRFGPCPGDDRQLRHQGAQERRQGRPELQVSAAAPWVAKY